MLALTRKKGESLMVNNNVEITVLEVRGDQVKIGINAPKSVPIYRKEIYVQIQEANKDALTADGFGKNARKTHHREGDDIVQQHHQQIIDKGGDRRRIKAQDHLDHRIDECGHQSPFCAITVGDKQQRHHACSGDGTTLRHPEDGDHRKDNGECDHDSAFGKHTDFLISHNETSFLFVFRHKKWHIPRSDTVL